MFISVIICTYRRPERLERALASLERQTHQGDDWEVLVIENDGVGSPAMKAVCERHKDALPLRHIVEPQVGLSHARNTGARLSEADYLGYLDDDAEADPTWLAAIIQECRESRPDFCGGPSHPLYRTPKPDWYLDRYARGAFYGDHPRWLNQGEWMDGCNLIVKRSLCAQLGGFKVDLGMVGTTLAYGEETDLLVRAWAANPQLKIRYLPQASAHHERRPEKLTLRWNLKAAWAGGRSSTIMSPLGRKQATVGLLQNAKWIVRQAGHAGLCWRQNKKQRLCWQQWVMEEFCPWLWHVSRSWHAMFRGKPAL